jgi:hypothetical protein
MVVTDLSTCFRFLVSPRIPPELVLKTIQHLPFANGNMIASLRASPRLKDIIDTYEHSITRCFMRKELRHASVDFPYNGTFGLKWLSACVSRYDVVDSVMNELTWRDNCVAVEPHNVAAVNTGLLLLYHLASIRKSHITIASGSRGFRRYQKHWKLSRDLDGYELLLTVSQKTTKRSSNT